MLELVPVNEVLREDVRRHAIRVAILQRDVTHTDNVINPSNTNLVHTIYVPERRSSSGLHYLRRGLVVLVEVHAQVAAQDPLPQVQRRYAYRAKPEIAGYQFGFYR